VLFRSRQYEWVIDRLDD